MSKPQPGRRAQTELAFNLQQLLLAHFSLVKYDWVDYRHLGYNLEGAKKVIEHSINGLSGVNQNSVALVQDHVTGEDYPDSLPGRFTSSLKAH